MANRVRKHHIREGSIIDFKCVMKNRPGVETHFDCKIISYDRASELIVAKDPSNNTYSLVVGQVIKCRNPRKSGEKLYEKYPSEYESWRSMKRRCYDPSTSSYERYGGEGIAVCTRWRKAFEYFLKDMGPKPDSTYTIDRLDNSKGYYPENCRWATKTQQNLNRRKLTTRKTQSKYVGLEYQGDAYKSKPWRVRVSGKHIGTYADEKEAALAYNEAAREIYGDDAPQNIIN